MLILSILPAKYAPSTVLNARHQHFVQNAQSNIIFIRICVSPLVQISHILLLILCQQDCALLVFNVVLVIPQQSVPPVYQASYCT